MGLYIKLKPGEKLLIEGKAAIINGDERAHFLVESDGAIIRERDLMTERQADTPCKKLYFQIQSMFLAGNKGDLPEEYLNLMRDIKIRVPGSGVFLGRINEMVSKETYYLALKEARALMKHENKKVEA